MGATARKVDWARILADLKAGGLSQDDIAHLLTQRGYRVSQGTVSRWALGKSRPDFDEGAELLDMHAGLTFSDEPPVSAAG